MEPDLHNMEECHGRKCGRSVYREVGQLERFMALYKSGMRLGLGGKNREILGGEL